MDQKVWKFQIVLKMLRESRAIHRPHLFQRQLPQTVHQPWRMKNRVLAAYRCYSSPVKQYFDISEISLMHSAKVGHLLAIFHIIRIQFVSDVLSVALWLYNITQAMLVSTRYARAAIDAPHSK